MFGDRGVAGIRQTDFAKSCSTGARWHFVARCQRQEAAGQQLNHFVASQFAGEHLTDDGASGTEDVEGKAIDALVAQKAFLGGGTGDTQGVALTQAQLGA